VPIYRIYGLRVQTEFLFANRLVPSGDGQADLQFTVLEGSGSDPGDLGELIYSSPYRQPEGQPWCQLYVAEQVQWMRIPQVADFRFEDSLIECLPHPEADVAEIEIHFLGAVLSYVLERRGILARHASAVRIEDRVVGFLSANAGGKTGLAATLMLRGHPLLSDDILAVEESRGSFVGHAGYPQMRMWPDQAAHFCGVWRHLPSVHSLHDKRRVDVGSADGLGAFAADSAVLDALYIVDRRSAAEIDSPRIETLRPAAALRELLRHSFTPYVVEAVGLGRQRLLRLSHLVQQVVCRRLIYASGFDRLAAAAAAIESDLASR